MTEREGDANATPPHAAKAPDPFSYSIRVAVFFAALFLIYGVQVPYFAVWLDWRGLSANDIGIMLSAPYLIRLMVTPAIAVYADQHSAHRQAIVWLAAAGLILTIGMQRAEGFWPMLLCVVPLVLALTTIMPLTETIAVAGVRAAGADYGRMRLWGSMTFIAASSAAGLAIDDYGAEIIGPVLVGTAALTAAAALLLPRPSEKQQRNDGSHRLAWNDVRRLAASPLFLIFLLAAGAVQGAHAMFYTFGAVHWRGQGLSAAWVGVLWAVGIMAEIMLFAMSGALVERFGATRLLVLGAGAAVARWIVMAFDPPLGLLLPLQALHGLTYGAMHSGAIRFIQSAVPEIAQGSAQAFYATIASGLALGLATSLSGKLYGSLQGQTYLAMAAMAAVGFIASLMLARRWKGEVLT